MHEIHPVIRIVSFVVLTAFVALGDVANVLMGATLLALLYIQLDEPAWPAAWRLLRRMRWLFLSIAVIYLWLTPGEPLFPIDTALIAWLPTVEGLWQGGLRIAALVVMVSAATLLLHATPRDQILSALRWLLVPLGLLGFPHERFAVRATLTLEAVSQTQDRLRHAETSVPTHTGSLTRIANVAAAVFSGVVGEAENCRCEAITLPAQTSPSWLQWGIPLALLVVMAMARQMLS